MPGFAEVRLRNSRKRYYNFSELELRPGDPVIVASRNGEDFGRVSALGQVAERKCSSSTGCATPKPKGSVVRLATSVEVKTASGLKEKDVRSCLAARAHVRSRGLRMKVTDACWQFDKRRLILYFTAQRRVDFRALVRDLAKVFRTRIELRQIGVREEASILGGVGRCGRELCCTTWLPKLRPVSLQLAREQNLKLNPGQISGCCGRLMCCLLYEHDAYVEARRNFPRVGRRMRTRQGSETVTSIDVLNETLSLRSDSGAQRTVRLKELKEEVRAIRRRGASPGK